MSLIYHGDSGYGAELSYFNIFDQSARKAIGPDNPCGLAGDEGSRRVLANSGFPIPSHGMERHDEPL